MRRTSFMLIAGETSGDLLAADLVRELRRQFTDAEALGTEGAQPLYASLEPEFFGAGGPNMKEAGVELALDMTRHAVIGLWEAIANLAKFRRIFHQLRALAIQRQPDVIICVDFGGFNLRFAESIRRHIQSEQGTFLNWKPKLVQYVSPQVWASRPRRAEKLGRDYDLLLSTLPFEKKWYQERVPELQVEWVGHPIKDRYRGIEATPTGARTGKARRVVLLPGSRMGELRRHIPLLISAATLIQQQQPVAFQMVVPNERLAEAARNLTGNKLQLDLVVGDVADALRGADLALTKSGTITLECALFRVPAVVFYKTSGITYLAGRYFVTVKYLSMPNLLADEPIFPEFIQQAATPEAVAGAALELLRDEARQAAVRAKLAAVVTQLGQPGASVRAAGAILRLLYPRLAERYQSRRSLGSESVR